MAGIDGTSTRIDGSEAVRRQCAFCGTDGPLTREHVWPKWLGRVLGDGGNEPYGAADDEELQRTWLAPVASLTVKQVCSECNNGWMAALEERARPILMPMLDASACTLDSEAQETLAAWAAKTLAVCDLAMGEPSLDQIARNRLLSEPIPDGCVFLLARYCGSRFPLHTGRWVRAIDMEIGGRRESRRVGLLSISFGSVVLQLFAHGLPNATLAPVGKKSDFARVIWPIQGTCWWPLPLALGDDGLRTFMREL